MIDMSFLTVSSETYREARKLFFSTTTFSFSSSRAPQLFLDKAPSDLIPHIKSLRLEMSLDYDASDDDGVIGRWRAYLVETIPRSFVGIQKLDITIYSEGYVTCWRKSQAEIITSMFRPLHQLTQLRDVTVILLDRPLEMYWVKCRQSMHDWDRIG